MFNGKQCTLPFYTVQAGLAYDNIMLDRCMAYCSDFGNTVIACNQLIVRMEVQHVSLCVSELMSDRFLIARQTLKQSIHVPRPYGDNYHKTDRASAGAVDLGEFFSIDK